MNITSARYIADLDGENNVVEVVSDGIKKCVPLDNNNIDYQAVLEWVDAGNTITAA